MNSLNYNRVQFLKSAQDTIHLPPDIGAEVAFAGRSNAGKSSALNTITGIKGLARTSKTPGRTQLINFFELDLKRRLVDLPGYGYAKVPDSIKDHWQLFLSDYLLERECLKGLILLMDIRHPLTPLDWQLIDWVEERRLPIHILLTKSDKLRSGAAKNAVLEINKQIANYKDWITVQLFSSLKKTGIIEVKQKLDEWFQL